MSVWWEPRRDVVQRRRGLNVVMMAVATYGVCVSKGVLRQKLPTDSVLSEGRADVILGSRLGSSRLHSSRAAALSEQ